MISTLRAIHLGQDSQFCCGGRLQFPVLCVSVRQCRLDLDFGINGRATMITIGSTGPDGGMGILRGTPAIGQKMQIKPTEALGGGTCNCLISPKVPRSQNL